MKRWLIPAGGALSVLFALVLVAGVIRTRDSSLERRSESPSEAVTRGTRPYPPVAPGSLEVATEELNESDPALDWISARSRDLVPDFISAEDAHPILARWIGLYHSEPRVIYQSAEKRRWITLTAARVECEDVDRVLEEFDDLQVGRVEACARWLEETRTSLARHGISSRDEREFLRDLGIDTSVRVMLIYAGWERDAESDPDDLEAIRLVRAHAAPIYPQSEFGTARRIALDRVMRALMLGPYAEEPVADAVAMLLNW